MSKYSKTEGMVKGVVVEGLKAKFGGYPLTDAMAFQQYFLYPKGHVDGLFLTDGDQAGCGNEVFLASRKDGAASMRKSDDPTNPDFDRIDIKCLDPMKAIQKDNRIKPFESYRRELAHVFFAYDKKTGNITEVHESLSFDQMNELLDEAWDGNVPIEVQREITRRTPTVGETQSRKVKVESVVDIRARKLAEFMAEGATPKTAKGKARKV